MDHSDEATNTNTYRRQDAYVTERLRELLAREVTPSKHVHKERKTRADTGSWTYFMPQKAKEGLTKLVPHRNYLPTYLNLVALINPNYRFWFDTRPDELKASDGERLQLGLLPFWTTGEDILDTYITIRLRPETIECFAQVALDYGIGLQTYIVRTKGIHPYEGLRSTPLDKLHLIPAKRRSGWFLRALGMGYLMPNNQPTDIKAHLPSTLRWKEGIK